jgi:hypothetical protein
VREMLTCIGETIKLLTTVVLCATRGSIPAFAQGRGGRGRGGIPAPLKVTIPGLQPMAARSQRPTARRKREPFASYQLERRAQRHAVRGQEQQTKASPGVTLTPEPMLTFELLDIVALHEYVLRFPRRAVELILIQDAFSISAIPLGPTLT